jgi:nucleoside-diphosphate-sugar epimerase
MAKTFTSQTNILLTGATGIIGRHVLYEFLAKYASGELSGQIVVLARPKSNCSGHDRVAQLLSHPYMPEYIKQYKVETLLDFIKVIESDLTSLTANDTTYLKSLGNFYVIHLAASTNLAQSEKAQEDIYRNNYVGSLNLLNICLPFTRKFVFIGTAFSSGHRAGLIGNDFSKLSNKENRNHYEALKESVEKEITQVCEKHSIEWQILRPSIVCGRLLDAPLYFTPKFNVFYGFGKFFNAIGQSNNKHLQTRILANTKSGINVVPADYVAKVIARVYNMDEVRELNIAHSKSIPNTFFIPLMLNKSGYENFTFVDKMPDDLNLVENIYYKSVGPQFTGYLNTPEHEFDTSLLRELLSDIEEPDVEGQFGKIYDFALQNNFIDPA